MFKRLRTYIKGRKLRKQNKAELIATINDINQKLKVQIDKAVLTIEELDQEKLYFLFVDVDNEEEIDHIKQTLDVVKKHMKWTAPNILILNRPITELSEEKLKELEKVRKQLKRGVKHEK